MQDRKIEFRKPTHSDIDAMFELLSDSLSPYAVINSDVLNRNRLILSRDVVSGYVSDNTYFSVIAQIDHIMVGWLSGSSQKKVLLEHKCFSGEFYIEEIVVHPSFRRMGVGLSLLGSIPIDGVKTLVVDTPRINERAIAFYKHTGFEEVLGLPDNFTEAWIRLLRHL